MIFRLLVDGPETRLPISLKGSREWLIGHSQDADIRIDNPRVSRRHALLWLDGNRLYVRDIAARNSTQVNGQALSGERELRPGDRVLFGGTSVEVQARDASRLRLLRSENDLDERIALAALADAPLGRGPMRALRELVDSTRPVTRVEDAAQLILDACFSAARRAVVVRLGPQDRLDVIAARGDDASGFEVTRRMLSLLREQRAPLWIRGSTGTGEDTTNDEGMPPQIIAPLITRGRLTGLLILEQDAAESTVDELTRIDGITKILGARLETLDALTRLADENAQLKRRASVSGNFLGDTRAIQELKARVCGEELAARGHVICGEIGVGRRALARWLHLEATRNEGATHRPFVSIDCSALSADEAAILFANASTRREDAPVAPARSLFAQAQHGTLCLHEVSALSRELRLRIARLHASGKVDRAGVREDLEVRLIVTQDGEPKSVARALGQELAKQCRSKRAMWIPPLRQHLEDLVLLCSFFLDEIANGGASPRAEIGPRAMDRLRTHSWPGNVAELRQTVHTASILAGGKAITPRHLPKAIGSEEASARGVELPSLEDVEREHIRRVLDAVGGNKLLASKTLGIANSTLYQKMKKYEIGG